MASAGQASVLLQEDHFLVALDGIAELAVLRRSVQALRPEQQPQAWAGYARQLEARLRQAYEQLATLGRNCELLRVAQRAPDAAQSPPGEAAAHVDEVKLGLLARVRAEQLMTLRLLDTLARCASACPVKDEGETSALLDLQQRRELRARDLEESLAEHRALWQAGREQLMRSRDGRGAVRLRLPGLWHDGPEQRGLGQSRP